MAARGKGLGIRFRCMVLVEEGGRGSGIFGRGGEDLAMRRRTWAVAVGGVFVMPLCLNGLEKGDGLMIHLTAASWNLSGRG